MSRMSQESHRSPFAESCLQVHDIAHLRLALHVVHEGASIRDRPGMRPEVLLDGLPEGHRAECHEAAGGHGGEAPGVVPLDPERRLRDPAPLVQAPALRLLDLQKRVLNVVVLDHAILRHRVDQVAHDHDEHAGTIVVQVEEDGLLLGDDREHRLVAQLPHDLPGLAVDAEEEGVPEKQGSPYLVQQVALDVLGQIAQDL
mmetsp:Transcript_64869/g.200910  ORF Transcript_64869/g.200910 Transcript_64869/m.200910 type:complete len:200 (-) Transcript_64869:1746-2345(-)